MFIAPTPCKMQEWDVKERMTMINSVPRFLTSGNCIPFARYHLRPLPLHQLMTTDTLGVLYCNTEMV